MNCGTVGSTLNFQCTCNLAIPTYIWIKIRISEQLLSSVLNYICLNFKNHISAHFGGVTSIAIFDKSASRLEPKVPIHLKVESLMQRAVFYIKWLLLGNQIYLQYNVYYNSII